MLVIFCECYCEGLSIALPPRASLLNPPSTPPVDFSFKKLHLIASHCLWSGVQIPQNGMQGLSQSHKCPLFQVLLLPPCSKHSILLRPCRTFLLSHQARLLQAAPVCLCLECILHPLLLYQPSTSSSDIISFDGPLGRVSTTAPFIKIISLPLKVSVPC